MTKILVVDDERSVLESTQMLLTEMGYEAVVALDPLEALDMLPTERPDAVLQDVRMPGLDLDRHMNAIRCAPGFEDVPVILFSATMELPEIAARVGAVAFIEKPFAPETLDGVIRSVLAPPPTAPTGVSR